MEDSSKTCLQRPSTNPRQLTPIHPRSVAFQEGSTLESRVQQLLQSWMEHFDQRFQDLANIRDHRAAHSYNAGQSEMFKEFAGRDSAEPRFTFQDSAFAESRGISFVKPEQQSLGELSQQWLSESARAGEMKRNYKKDLEDCNALKARQTVKERMLDLHQHLSRSKTSIIPRGLKSVLHHPLFESVISLAIITNGIIIGVQVEITARSGPGDHPVFAIAEVIFFLIFVAELFLRIYGLRSQWIKSPWNIFDAALVLIQLFEFVLKISGGTMSAKGGATGRVLRVVRLLRIVRVLRLLRFFSQLRVMVKMIMFSLDSLFWLMILLCVMMYIVSIMITQGFNDYANSTDLGSDRMTSLEYCFGDLSRSAWTLFQSITNGVSWGPLAEDLIEIHFIFFMIYVCFMFFVFFSVLNVVTGVFVDGAIQHAGQEREVLVAAERASLEGICAKLTELLVDIDIDGNGCISLDELIQCGKDPNLASYFSALEIHTPETAELFAFLDRDEDGQIDVREFIDGCLRIRGGARNVDLHMLMFRMEGDQMQLRKKFVETSRKMEKSIASLHRHISEMRADLFASADHSSGLRYSLTPRESNGPPPIYDPQTPREVELYADIPFDAHMGRCVPYSPRSHTPKRSHITKQRA